MTTEIQMDHQPQQRKGFSGMQVLGIVLAAMAIAIAATAFVIKIYLFPSPFTPVTLSPGEEQQLSAKLAVFEGLGAEDVPKKGASTEEGTLQPETYSEAGASRQISFSERELNAMVAKNTDLAEKMAIDLAENMISLKLLIPLDPDFPFLGGQTLRVNAGAELAYREGRPIVMLKGVSLMGVPLPNAWLGGLKNVDLVREFGADEGFWKTFADGVNSIRVVEGFLRIQLKE